MVVQGTIEGQPAILILERSAFASTIVDLTALVDSLSRIQNLGHNDVYTWFLASSSSTPTQAPDLKLNLIYPCTDVHVKKYSAQGVRMVTETPATYEKRVRPFMQRKRDEGRLNWVWNILEGRTEQEDVILRVDSHARADDQDQDEGFLLLPDL